MLKTDCKKNSDKNASEYQAGGDSKRENLCQHDSERVNKTTPGIKLGQLVATEDPSSEQKIHLNPNPDGEKYIRKFDDPAKKKSSRRAGKSTNFTIKYWTGPVQDLVKTPPNLEASPRNVAIRSLCTSDRLWASSWTTKDHEDFKSMAIKKRTQDLIQSVQRHVKILIDRKDAYNRQILQDWNT